MGWVGRVGVGLHCPSFLSSQSMSWLSPSAYLLT